MRDSEWRIVDVDSRARPADDDRHADKQTVQLSSININKQRAPPRMRILIMFDRSPITCRISRAAVFACKIRHVANISKVIRFGAGTCVSSFQ